MRISPSFSATVTRVVRKHSGACFHGGLLLRRKYHYNDINVKMTIMSLLKDGKGALLYEGNGSGSYRRTRSSRARRRRAPHAHARALAGQRTHPRRRTGGGGHLDRR